MASPTPYELWKQAGGQTDAFDSLRYRELLFAHGHMSGETAELDEQFAAAMVALQESLDKGTVGRQLSGTDTAP